MNDIVNEQIEQLREGSRKHWKAEMEERGVRAAWPDLVEETGNPVNALRQQARSLKGTYLGCVRDPETGEAAESAVVRSNLSKLIIGPPGQGKTTRVIIPGVLQDLAEGRRVVFVTPQPKTVSDVYRAAQEVSDSGEVSIVDFGGKIVEHGSSRLTTWDPTGRCDTAQGAQEFAEALAGKGSPVAADLGSGRGAGFWLQIPEVTAAAAGHLTKLERDMKERNALRRGLSPEQARMASLHANGQSGIGRVFDYLRRPAAADPAREGTPFQGLSRELRTELTPRQRQALRDQPSRLREMDGIIRDAAYHAAQFPLALQKLAYNRALLELQGAPVDQRLAGTEVEELAPIIENISKRESDPLDQLAKAVRQALPENEQRILSPRLGDSEISPDQIVKGPGGLYVVSYDSSGSTGLAPGWFTNEVVKAAFRESKDLEAERRLGGEERFTGLSGWIDEGGATGAIDPEGGNEGRQLEISMNYSATSIKQLEEEVGESRANMIVESTPVTINFAPTQLEASVISESFGKKEVPDVSNNYHSDSAGWTTNVSSKEVPMVPQDRVRNLKPGEVILTDSSSGSRRDNIVQTFPFYEANNPVGATMDYVQRSDGPDLPWEEMLPEARRRLDAKRAAKEALEAPPQPGALHHLGDQHTPAAVPRSRTEELVPVDGPEEPSRVRRVPGVEEADAPATVDRAPVQEPGTIPAPAPAPPPPPAPEPAPEPRRPEPTDF